MKTYERAKLADPIMISILALLLLPISTMCSNRAKVRAVQPVAPMAVADAISLLYRSINYANNSTGSNILFRVIGVLMALGSLLSYGAVLLADWLMSCITFMTVVAL